MTDLINLIKAVSFEKLHLKIKYLLLVKGLVDEMALFFQTILFVICRRYGLIVIIVISGFNAGIHKRVDSTSKTTLELKSFKGNIPMTIMRKTNIGWTYRVNSE